MAVGFKRERERDVRVLCRGGKRVVVLGPGLEEGEGDGGFMRKKRVKWWVLGRVAVGF